MAEERGAVVGDQLEARLDRLEQGMARMEGRFEQVDKRLSNVQAEIGDVRRDIRKVLYLVVGAIAVPILLEPVRRMMH